MELNVPTNTLLGTAKKLQRMRADKKVVLAGGTFDIIHPGHLNYLRKCRASGDLLVVYVAGDNRTRRRKGPTRPILPATQRAKLVSNLKMVDLAFVSDSSPFSDSILRKIKPAVIVTSSNEPSRIVKLDFQRRMRHRHPEIKVVLLRRPSFSWSSTSLVESLSNKQVKRKRKLPRRNSRRHG